MNSGFVKKRGNTWTVYFYISDALGNRRQRTKGGFRTKKEAQVELNSVLTALRTSAYVEPTKLTLGAYLTERWLPLMEHSLRPSTFDSYRRMLELHVLPHLGGIPLQDVTSDQLDRLYTELLAAGRCKPGGGTLSPKTVRYIHNTIHKAFKDAERKKLVLSNPANAADPPKLRQAGDREMQTWTPEQLRTFLEGLEEHRLVAAFTLAATTGMRRGEVLGVRWSDIDLNARRLAVRQTVLTVNYKITLGTPKTSRGRRSIALDPRTVGALRAHRTRQADEKRLLGSSYQDQGLVFAKADGTPIHPDYFSQLFDRTVRRLQLPRIRLHDLRHTHATLGLSAGIAPKVISDRLGHATVAFTQDVYMHAIPRLEAEAADELGNLVFGAAQVGPYK